RFAVPGAAVVVHHLRRHRRPVPARRGGDAAPRRRRPRRVAQAPPARAGPPGAQAMREWLPFLVIGLPTGSVYAIAAMGLAGTHAPSGGFDVGHGALGRTAP